MRQLSKHTRILLVMGIFTMSFGTMTRSFITITEGADDFLKGFGLSVMICALIFDWITVRHTGNRKA